MNYIDRFRLDGRIALVSGGSRGIGEAICHGLAEQGAHVIVASRRRESCDVVASSIRERGYSAEAMACHAGKTEQIDALMDALQERYGGLDILVNNAGTNLHYGWVGETPMPAFDKTMEINFRGPFYLCSRAVPMMRQRGGGAIVNVASINGLIPGRWQGAYSSTKAAMINMTKAFALEYGADNIRCNALCPGMVRTRLSESVFQDEALAKSLEARWPLEGFAEPGDMVGAVLYMASEASSFMTGQIMVVDGGATSTLL